jgi:hypothetical protein
LTALQGAEVFTQQQLDGIHKKKSNMAKTSMLG